MSATSTLVEAASEQGATVGAGRAEKHATSLLLATDTCCQADHVIAEVERGGGEMPVVVCITCTELWGRREGLQSWQECCPRCFSETHPHGLTNLDLGITAQPPA